MCGIAGIIDSSLSKETAQQLLLQSLASIKHRGPDYTGTWQEAPVYLGHNRLSIIDLDARGHQPMIADHLIITFNGEIYNYLEIRQLLNQRGYHFKTGTDTEVILHAYREWGPECVNRFVGMWAFAIWDTEKKELFCSRDRFGIKPFYYIHSGDKFYFGSEYKALKTVPVFSTDLNMAQVGRGLQMNWASYRDESYFTCLRQIPAAHNLIYKNGKIRTYSYWDIDASKTSKLSFEDKKEEFRNAFFDSINIHLRSDVPTGACLSGGLDSSAIVSAIGKNYPKVNTKTYTIYYTGNDSVDERPWVKEVLKKYPHVENTEFMPNENDLTEIYEKTTHFQDIPLINSAIISQYYVMQLAAAGGIKVLLDGQGSDEYLAGYFHSFYRLVGNEFRKGNLSQGLSHFNAHTGRQGFSPTKKLNVLAKSMLSALSTEQSLYNTEYNHYYPFGLTSKPAKPFSLPVHYPHNKLNDFLYHLTFNVSLPTLLHYEDRNSSAFSLESRVPFLDHRLVELAFSYANEDKMYRGKTKYILREAMRGIMPDAIADRSDKKGFVTPGEIKWLRGSLSWLLEEPMVLDFIDKKIAAKEIQKFKKGDNTNANWIWRLTALNYWVKRI